MRWGLLIQLKNSWHDSTKQTTCVICETEYSAKENLCPKCGYPQLSITKVKDRYSAAINRYRGAYGIKTRKVPEAVSITDAEVGNAVKFGRYKQAHGTEPIEWKVLDKQEGKVLLISNYILDWKQYHKKGRPIVWELCSLRKWLNNEFLNTAFGESERNRISVTKCSADKSPNCDTNPGNPTYDKVFLLSGTEVHKYFKNEKDSRCVPSDTAVNARNDCESGDIYIGDDWYRGRGITWWLRSPGFSGRKYAMLANCFEYRSLIEIDVNDDGYVRPALWLIAEFQILAIGRLYKTLIIKFQDKSS